MLQESFEAEIAHVHATIAATPLREFAIPHLVIDNVFPDAPGRPDQRQLAGLR